jgi:hypothetical protein
MPANSPAQICQLFKQYMHDGDINSVLSLYDKDAAFLNNEGKPTNGEN